MVDINDITIVLSFMYMSSMNMIWSNRKVNVHNNYTHAKLPYSSLNIN